MGILHNLSEWAHTLPAKFGNRVQLRLIDAASIEGFFKALVRRFHRLPAFTVAGQRYVGSDFSRVFATSSPWTTRRSMSFQSQLARAAAGP